MGMIGKATGIAFAAGAVLIAGPTMAGIGAEQMTRAGWTIEAPDKPVPDRTFAEVAEPIGYWALRDFNDNDPGRFAGPAMYLLAASGVSYGIRKGWSSITA